MDRPIDESESQLLSLCTQKVAVNIKHKQSFQAFSRMIICRSELYVHAVLKQALLECQCLLSNELPAPNPNPLLM